MKNSFVFESNNPESFIKAFENLINTNDETKLKMRVSMKKSLKKFTMFNHFNSLKKILDF